MLGSGKRKNILLPLPLLLPPSNEPASLAESSFFVAVCLFESLFWSNRKIILLAYSTASLRERSIKRTFKKMHLVTSNGTFGTIP